jgi:predicted lipoprotein with Yx(FWY)xxD motif
MRSRIILSLGVLALAATISAVAFGRTASTRLKAERISALNATVLADTHGRTLYRLKPETAHHLLCTSKICLTVWVPLTVASKKKAHVKLPKGIKGPVTFLRRKQRFQIVVKGLPVYRFAGDTGPRKAAGQGIKSFGGTWSVLKIKASKKKIAPPPIMPGY